MSKKIYFKEIQTFNKVIPGAILLLLTSAWIFAMIWQIYFENPIGPYPVNNLGLILIGIILLSPLVMMMFLRMETQIRREGIFYKLKPLEFSWHKILISEIESFELITNKAKNKTQIKLKLKNKKKISINTKQGAKLVSALNKAL